MSEQLEIKKSLDKVTEMVIAMQKLDEERGTEAQSEIKTIGVKMTEVLGHIEVLKAEAKASEEKSKRLEAILARGGSDKEGKFVDPVTAEYKDAFCNYLRKGEQSNARSFISEEKRDSFIRAQLEKEFEGKGFPAKDLDVMVKTLRSDIGPDGAFFTLPDKGRIIKGRYFETTPMTELATVVSISSGSIMFP